jgi:capsular exopolysaccharide synthesis family protein
LSTNNLKVNTSKKKKLIIPTYTHPSSAISEQFRRIQTNLRFLATEHKSKSFLITSPGSKEGKSTVAINLAVLLAQQKKKVLLIDANLREPNIHSLFKLTNCFGLVDALTGKISFYEAINHTNIARLDVMTSGLVTFNPIELMESGMIEELLKKAMKSYDVVLLDSNSILEVAETKLLASLCEGVILVVRNGKTTLEKAKETKRILEFVKANIVGIVTNA